MEHNYLNTWFGKLQAIIVLPSIFIIFIGFAYQYSFGKEVHAWGIPVSIIGLLMFLKAKWSVLKNGKFFTFGCDPMNQTNTYFYFLGWVMMIAGYFISFI